MKKLLSILVVFTFVSVCDASYWYLDNSVSSSGNGQSWATAWKNPSNIVWGSGGVIAGDTLYISGGSSSQTYTASANHMMTIGASGSNGSPITVATGAKSPSPSGHDGMVIFDANNSYYSLVDADSTSYVTLDGEKNGAINWKFQNISMAASDDAAVEFASSNFFSAKYLEIVTTPMGLYGTYANDSEISYCYIHDLRQECAIRTIISNSGATTYGRTKLHNNTVQVLTAAPNGYGPDGFQTGVSTDIYNNSFSSANGLIGGAQHPDYVQCAGHYTRIYNNTFKNPIDSAVDFDVSGNMDGYWDHIWIYNNVFVCDSTISVQASWPSGIRMYNNTDMTITDIVIANNDFVDWGASADKAGFPLRIQTGGSASVSNTLIKNNLFYNSGNSNYGAVVIEASSGANAADWNFDYNLINAGSGGSNVVLVDGASYSQVHNITSAPTFTTYTAGNSGNVYTLSSSDTSAQNTGVSLSAYFTTDLSGTSRPQGSAWDIGAYEYSSGGGGGGGTFASGRVAGGKISGGTVK